VRAAALVTVASVALAAAAYPIWRVLDGALGRSWPAQIVSLGTALAVGGAVYLVAARALRVREIEALLALKRRFGRP
jgi:hypothetical protein